MQAKTIIVLMRDVPTWLETDAGPDTEFINLMSAPEIQYSEDELKQAWHFFLCGWIAHGNQDA